MACIMLMFSAISKPVRRACCNCCRPRKDDVVPRDLELGDLERECWQNSGCAERGSGRSTEKQDERGMRNPDEFDVYGNPWYKISLDSLVGPRSLRVPTTGGGISRGSEDARVDELLHPDAFDIFQADTIAGTTAENTPEAGSEVDLGLVPLRAISTLDLDYYENEYEDGDEDSEGKATTVATRDFAAAGSDSTAPSSRPASSPGSFPSWLFARRPTAGTTASRFVEVDVDGLTIEPPEFDLIGEQQELLERSPVGGRTRGRRTWHAGQDRSEEPSDRAVARHSV